MAGRDKIVLAGYAYDGCEQPKGVRAAAVFQAAGLHFLCQGFSLASDRFRGAQQRLSGQDELQIFG